MTRDRVFTIAAWASIGAWFAVMFWIGRIVVESAP